MRRGAVVVIAGAVDSRLGESDDGPILRKDDGNVVLFAGLEIVRPNEDQTPAPLHDGAKQASCGSSHKGWNDERKGCTLGYWILR